jgi:hypothetical protein
MSKNKKVIEESERFLKLWLKQNGFFYVADSSNDFCYEADGALNRILVYLNLKELDEKKSRLKKEEKLNFKDTANTLKREPWEAIVNVTKTGDFQLKWHHLI